MVRLDRGLSQSQVAEALNVTTDTVTYWETNRCEPTAKFAKRIIEFLGYMPFQETDTFAKRLYWARLTAGKTQEEIAKELDCDESNLRRLELGTQSPLRKTREKIEQFIEEALHVRWMPS